MASKKPKIFIFIASWYGKVQTGFLKPFQYWVKNHDIQLQTTNHLIPLDYARNMAIERFLETDCDYFMGMDDDMVPLSCAIDEFIESKKDCIAPLIFTTKSDNRDEGALPIPVPITFVRKRGHMFVRVPNGEKYMEVDLLPGGLFFLSRKAVEAAKKPLFKYKYHKNGFLKGGTDMYMSERLQKAGFKLYVHTGMTAEQIIDIGAHSYNNAMVRYSPNQVDARIKELMEKGKTHG